MTKLLFGAVFAAMIGIGLLGFSANAYAADSVKEVDESNFAAEVEQSNLPVLVDFSATWCGPCQRLAPLLEKLAKEYKGKLKVVKVDVDQCPNLCTKYGVNAYPTLIFFKPNNGGTVKTVGGRSLQGLRDFVNPLLKK